MNFLSTLTDEELARRWSAAKSRQMGRECKAVMTKDDHAAARDAWRESHAATTEAERRGMDEMAFGHLCSITSTHDAIDICSAELARQRTPKGKDKWRRRLCEHTTRLAALEPLPVAAE